MYLQVVVILVWCLFLNSQAEMGGHGCIASLLCIGTSFLMEGNPALLICTVNDIFVRMITQYCMLLSTVILPLVSFISRFK